VINIKNVMIIYIYDTIATRKLLGNDI